MILAGVEVLVIGVATWWFRAMMPGGRFGLDLQAYFAAAERLVRTGSPYSVELLAGPIANEVANVPIGYLYPPPLAQVFVFLPDTPAFAIAWAVAQVALLGVLVVKFGHMARLPGRLGWFAWVLAWVAFFPLHMAVYVGNLSGWVALALGAILLDRPRCVGLLSALVAVMKGLTAPIVIAALAIRRYRTGAAVGIVAIAVPSCLISIRSWLDWIIVLTHLPGMAPGATPANLAFTVVFAQFGLPSLGDWIRFASLGVLTLATIHAVRRGRHRQALAMAGLAALLLSATAWDHHFALAAPIAAAAWPIASRGQRRAILLALVTQLSWWTNLVESPPVLLLSVLSLWVGALAAALALGGDSVASTRPHTLGASTPPPSRAAPASIWPWSSR